MVWHLDAMHGVVLSLPHGVMDGLTRKEYINTSSGLNVATIRRLNELQQRLSKWVSACCVEK